MTFTKIRIFSKNTTNNTRKAIGKGISALQWTGESFQKAKTDWFIVDGIKYSQT